MKDIEMLPTINQNGTPVEKFWIWNPPLINPGSPTA